jgi:O-acetyl-ADP-ribose deacetylase (regulator of RNase III)
MKLIVHKGDISALEVDALVVAANSRGEMGGGVAKAIKRAGGEAIEKEAKAQAPIPVGEAVLTSAGRLKAKAVIHAPTMEQPTQRTDREKVFRATAAALKLAEKKEFKTLALPGMGTGVGKVPPAEAARAMVEAVRAHWGKHLETIYLVDIGDEMVEAFQEAVKTPAA